MTFEGLNSSSSLHFLITANVNAIAVEMFFVVWLLVMCLVNTWFFKEKRISFIHESGLAIFYGIGFGSIIKYGPLAIPNASAEMSNNSLVSDSSHSNQDIELTTRILFYVLLPPIIFNAGYSVDQVNTTSALFFSVIQCRN